MESDPSHPHEQVESGAPEAVEAESRLNDLVAAALDHIDQHGESSLQEFLDRYPTQAESLRQRIATLRAFGFGEEIEAPKRMGGFRLLHKLGGGGMGVVYVAEQEGLGRQVALKLVRPELLYFPGSRERFRRELDALARLQHPSIVPVFDGGTENGVPYLAMEYVRGATLEEVLQSLRDQDPTQLSGRHLHAAIGAITKRRDAMTPERKASQSSGRQRAVVSGTGQDLPPLFAGSWVATCLKIGRCIAEALQHSHEQGVLHRDIKPSNLILTSEGRVLLMDFGLASTVGSTKLTGTGQAVGSPLYMSPEQMRGESDRIDERTDVYGLGLTLFEALTLQHPFAASTLEETRHKVLTALPVLPRMVNATIPKDAETVVLVAIDREPHRRYASAAAFGTDLTCVLELRPIHARRLGTHVRAQRWIQRHPALSVAIACAVLLFVGGPVLFAWQQHLANLEVGAALVEAKVQRDSAEQNFDRAERAVDLLLTQVVEQRAFALPEFAADRKRLLENALSFYEELLEERADEPRLLVKVAHAAYRKGFLLQELGRYEEALAAYERQYELACDLKQQSDPDVEVLRHLSWATGGIAACASFLGRNQQALVAIDACLSLHAKRRELQPQARDIAFDIDEALGRRAHIQSFGGQWEEAIATYYRLVELDYEILSELDGPDDLARVVANLLSANASLGSALISRERYDEAIDIVREAEGLIDAHREAIASTSDGVIAKAALLDVQGALAALQQDHRAAVNFRREAIALFESTLPALSKDLELLRLLAASWNNLAAALEQAGSSRSEIELAYQSALQRGRELVALAPNIPLYTSNLARTLMNYGALERDQGAWEAASKHTEEAWKFQAASHRLAPGQGGDRMLRFYIAWNLGLIYIDMQDAERAADAAERIASSAEGDGMTLRIAAGILARAVPFCTDPSNGTTRKRQALDWLRAAAEAGFADAENLVTASDLELLRNEPEFDAIHAIVKANAASGGPH